MIATTIGLFIKMFLDKKNGKKDWSVWANVASAVGTIIIGIVTIAIMRSQDDIQKRLMIMEENKNQPIFAVSEVEGMSIDSTIYDYEEFQIYNHGATVRKLEKVRPSVFIKLSFRQNDEIQNLYAPISDYYYFYCNTGSLTGEIAHSLGTSIIHNRLNYAQNIYWGKSSDPSIELVNSELIKIYTITYIDIFGDTRTCYFKGKEETNSDYVSEITNAAEHQFNYKTFSITDVTIDTIIATAEYVKNNP